MTEKATDAENAAALLPQTVVALGWVSLCTDLSSEMVYPLTPVLLTTVLGAPPEAVGLIEGAAETTASVLKLYSGKLSDAMGQRKPLTLWGYGLAAVSKPLLGAAGSWSSVLAARLLDRTGKGLRAAPRDALIAGATPQSMRGRAFGLHRSMDTCGAVLGPLVGWAFLHYYPDKLRSVYTLALVPALFGLLVLAFFVREAPASRPVAAAVPKDNTAPRFVFDGLSKPYRRFLFAVALFGLGNSSDAFLLLRAKDLGIAPAYLLLLYALFNVVETALGYFAGKWSDRIGRHPLIISGWLVFALVYSGFALIGSPVWVWALFPIYGLYYTLTQGSAKALAADLSHPDRRGAEIGAFHLLTGIAALPASLLAGYLYGHVGQSVPFWIGAGTAVCAALVLAAAPKTP